MGVTTTCSLVHDLSIISSVVDVYTIRALCGGGRRDDVIKAAAIWILLNKAANSIKNKEAMTVCSCKYYLCRLSLLSVLSK